MGRHVSSRRARVVALLPAGASAPQLPARAEAVIVISGYEAAAELLAGTVAALLVDLSRITPPHRKLLTVADELAVPVVAYGTVSASLEGQSLQSVRLVTRESAGAAIEQLLPAAEPPAEAEAKLPLTEIVPPPAAPPKPASPPVAEPLPSQYRPAPTEAEQPPQPANPSDLLTDEELKALLEDQP